MATSPLMESARLGYRRAEPATRSYYVVLLRHGPAGEGEGAEASNSNDMGFPVQFDPYQLAGNVKEKVDPLPG